MQDHIEVEIKLKIEDKDQLKLQLIQSGFTEGECVTEKDVYYTAAHHDFAALDEALRVRSVENMTTGETSAAITYKGAKLDQKSMTRQELETEVGDAEICREILCKIGFTPVPPVVKVRRYFYKGKMTACVDTVDGLGDYLELEKLIAADKERNEALDEIEMMLKKLGYSMQDTTRTSYLSMLMKKQEIE